MTPMTTITPPDGHTASAQGLVASSLYTAERKHQPGPPGLDWGREGREEEGGSPKGQHAPRGQHQGVNPVALEEGET